MAQHRCLICIERLVVKINLGFVACRERNATFPRLILKESYEKDYRPDSWVFNSGDAPYTLWKQHNKTAHIAARICDAPDWSGRNQFLKEKGVHNWTNKIAHHSYLHERDYTINNLAGQNTSFAEMLNWILFTAPAPFQPPTIPSTTKKPADLITAKSEAVLSPAKVMALKDRSYAEKLLKSTNISAVDLLNYVLFSMEKNDGKPLSFVGEKKSGATVSPNPSLFENKTSPKFPLVVPVKLGNPLDGLVF